MKDKIIYQLTVEDIQTVAKQEFGKKLTSAEIDKIIETIGKKIPWYDAIQNAINEKLEIKT